MIRITLIIVLVLFIQPTLSAQSCLPDGITFSTQSEIHNFQTNHPDCTEIEGAMTISEDDISNLIGLNILTSIGGVHWIGSNAALSSLSNLDNIDAGSISDLYINDNLSLSTCEVVSVCDYLAIPGEYIEIHDNAIGCNTQEEADNYIFKCLYEPV